VSYPQEQRSALEKRWASQQASANLPSEDLEVWLRHKHVMRLMLGRGRTLIHYIETAAGPEILGVYQVSEVNADFDTGLSFCLKETTTGAVHSFGHSPKLLPGSTVFIWVTYFPDMQHTLLDTGKWGTWFAVAMKFASSPEYHNRGTQYLMDVRNFRRLYPDNSKTSF
jgi:hypothetical protein